MKRSDDERASVLLQGRAGLIERESARLTRRSLLTGGVAAAAGYAAWRAVGHSMAVGGLPKTLRTSIDANAALSRAVFREHGLSPTYDFAKVVPARMNGIVGIVKPLVPATWRLQVTGVGSTAARSPLFTNDVTAWQYRYAHAKVSNVAPDFKTKPGKSSKLSSTEVTADRQSDKGFDEEDDGDFNSTGKRQGSAEAGASSSSLAVGTPGLLLTMDEIRQLPRVDFATEFKCVEGWSQITRWAGVRLRDFIEAFPPAPVNGRMPRFVYMETPDGDYYCGYDMEAARHPQSTLVTEMNGSPLTPEHGAPLRLHMPIKYGYKQIKRIGLIAYTDTQPDDYWTKLGYDWYAGL